MESFMSLLLYAIYLGVLFFISYFVLFQLFLYQTYKHTSFAYISLLKLIDITTRFYSISNIIIIYYFNIQNKGDLLFVGIGIFSILFKFLINKNVFKYEILPLCKYSIKWNLDYLSPVINDRMLSLAKYKFYI